MRISVSLAGEVKNGQLVIHKRHLLKACIQSLEGRQVTLILEQKSAERTLEQNKYLHALFQELKKFCGADDVSMVEFKNQIKEVLGYSYRDENGFLCYAKTHLMNKVELGEFIETLRAWAHVTLNFYLMTPAEFKAIHNEKYYEEK